MNRPGRFALVIAAALFGAAPAFPGVPPAAERDRRAELQAAFVEAYNARAWDRAEEAVVQWAELRPDDWTPIWNLACVLAAQGKNELAAGAIRKALDLGFCDFRLVDRGVPPALRQTPVVQEIFRDWPALQDRALEQHLARLKAEFSKGYRVVKDERLRLAYVHAYSDEAFADARRQVESVSAWWAARVAGDDHPPVLAGDRADPWVVIVLPTKGDYARWSARVVGAPRGAISAIAGLYDPDRHELVTQDLGATLRHEFLHVLHWRVLKREGLSAPLWAMEGLASLVEDLKPQADGPPEAVPSWRTNSAVRLAKSGGVMPLPKFVELPADQFTARAPLANYALARALMLYLDQRSALRAYFDASLRPVPGDASGRAALEAALGKPLTDIDKSFRQWLRELPIAPEADRPGRAVLPMDLGPATGDGLPITRLGRGVEGLRERDVLTAIAGQAVKDADELARVLGDFEPGQRVEVSFRRGKQPGKASVTLQVR